MGPPQLMLWDGFLEGLATIAKNLRDGVDEPVKELGKHVITAINQYRKQMNEMPAMLRMQLLVDAMRTCNVVQCY